MILSILEGSVIRLFRFSLFRKGLLSYYSDSPQFGRVFYQIIQIISILEGSVVGSVIRLFRFYFGMVCYHIIQIHCNLEGSVIKLFRFSLFWKGLWKGLLSGYSDSLYFGRVCYQIIQILSILEGSVIRLFRFSLFWKGLLSDYSEIVTAVAVLGGVS